MKRHLGTITIISDDRHANSAAMQKIMTANSRLIRARLGVNLAPLCAEKCSGLIVLIVDGSEAEIKVLAAKLNKLKAVKAKALIITK
jgi:metal-responsive CopG/Arc/MetJ family transcriptional regulator